jgi:phage baseplate assembly protein W
MIIIDTPQEVRLDWGAKGSKRVAQNVSNLLNTLNYEVAYDRTLGLNSEIIHKPSGALAALYTAEVYRVVQDYEPRAIVQSVQVKGVTDDGNIDSLVVIET